MIIDFKFKNYMSFADECNFTMLANKDKSHEGEMLHHCVGRMNYDQKFAKEQSLIFFLRDKSAPETPLVTMEYSPSQKRLLQCYGDHDADVTRNNLFSKFLSLSSFRSFASLLNS